MKMSLYHSSEKMAKYSGLCRGRYLSFADPQYEMWDMFGYRPSSLPIKDVDNVLRGLLACERRWCIPYYTIYYFRIMLATRVNSGGAVFALANTMLRRVTGVVLFPAQPLYQRLQKFVYLIIAISAPAFLPRSTSRNRSGRKLFIAPDTLYQLLRYDRWRGDRAQNHKLEAEATSATAITRLEGWTRY